MRQTFFPVPGRHGGTSTRTNPVRSGTAVRSSRRRRAHVRESRTRTSTTEPLALASAILRLVSPHSDTICPFRVRRRNKFPDLKTVLARVTFDGLPSEETMNARRQALLK
eukprot:scaffold495128_cov17-Prasinocladus_malaysianus.AAC.1